MDVAIYSFQRDDVRRRIRVTAHAPLSAADLVAILGRQAEEGAWTYGVLYDLRHTTGATSMADAVVVVTRVEELSARYGPRGPVALVTRSAEMIGAGHAYADHTVKLGFVVEVFWDLDEAEQWLDRA